MTAQKKIFFTKQSRWTTSQQLFPVVKRQSFKQYGQPTTAGANRLRREVIASAILYNMHSDHHVYSWVDKTSFLKNSALTHTSVTCTAAGFCVNSGLRGAPSQRVYVRHTRASTSDTASYIERTLLGNTGIEVSSGGIGAWSWGDRSGYWGFNKEYTRSDNEKALAATVEEGFSFVDTAEVYGFGLSEEILGAAIKKYGVQPFIATKFAPLPWRFSSASVAKALRASLQRLSVSQIGLYQIHWPGFLTQGFSNDNFIKGLADCANQGLTQAVGVSNFKAERVRKAVRILEAEGQQLASNQVQYSLAYRVPESNEVYDAVKAHGATLIAYSPLCQGLLTGKYNKDNLPSGPRSAVINEKRLKEVEPLLRIMREICVNRGKTVAQVAINWTLCKGALPIPGAKNAEQVKEAAGAFNWKLNSDELSSLDHESSKISPSLANPVEKF